MSDLYENWDNLTRGEKFDVFKQDSHLRDRAIMGMREMCGQFCPNKVYAIDCTVGCPIQLMAIYINKLEEDSDVVVDDFWQNGDERLNPSYTFDVES